MLPSGFESSAVEPSHLSAELNVESDAHRLTVRGSKPGLHFSRSVSLPFPAAEGDIELEHRPRDGLLKVRVRKPLGDKPSSLTLPIKRTDEPARGPEGRALPPDDAPVAVQSTLPDKMATVGIAHSETAALEQQQQQLDEKFAFVKQVKAAQTAPAATETTKAAMETATEATETTEAANTA